MHPLTESPEKLRRVLEEVVQAYQLGSFQTYHSLGGLDALNRFVATSRGCFVVKLFSPQKKRAKVDDQVRGLLAFQQADIPVPQLQSQQQDYVYRVQNVESPFYVYVTDFFEGRDFRKLNPRPKDLQTIAHYLARIHTLNFDIQPNDDPWGTVQVPRAFETKKQYLDRADLALVEPTVQAFAALDLSRLPQSVIHGDLHRQHVLKRGRHYCLLDLGYMDKTASVLDLAICAAHFLPGLPEKDRPCLFQAYNKERPLTAEEREALPTMIRATYAAYLIGAQDCIRSGDTRPEILEWADFARRGLKSRVDFFE